MVEHRALPRVWISTLLSVARSEALSLPAPGLHDLPHERGGDGPVRGETEGSPARQVRLQFVPERVHHARVAGKRLQWSRNPAYHTRDRPPSLNVGIR